MWHKLGLIYSLPANSMGKPWLFSHGQVPVADHLSGNIFRVYFAGRTKEQISHISYLELDITKPSEILNISESPVLYPGELGCFDHCGVYPSSIITIGHKKYLYYIGWIRGYESPMFYAAIGLAISIDGGKTFQRYANVPIMDRSIYDPCLVTAPHVFIDKGIFRMTYVSGQEWKRNANGILKSEYNIKIAQSIDGIHWHREGLVAVNFDTDETNIARPWVIKNEKGIYQMWFSSVKNLVGKYRIGYSESNDFVSWQRNDSLAGITISENSFDSEMICYTNIICHNGKKYMFYNGNNFGKEGIGLAVEENDVK